MKTESRKSWLLTTSLCLALGLFAFLALIVPAGLRAQAGAPTANLITNPGFENGVTRWKCVACRVTAGAPAYAGAAAGQLRNTTTKRGQLQQSGLSLYPTTEYQLTFWAKAPGGQDVQVDLLKQSTPFTNYGLNETVDLTAEWQQFTLTFTTAGFNATVDNGRLRFRTPKGKGLQFSIDEVSLVALSEPPTPTPSPTPVVGSELVVFDWNKPVTTAQKGFPWDNPPMPSANGDWTQPINFAEGTLHLRAEIFSIPVPQDDMKLQICFWQYSNARENCTRARDVPGRAGTVVEWSVPVQDMWKKGGTTINWADERDRNGFAIKNGQGLPVSNYSGWNWNGEDPDEWYPMVVRFTVVVVEKGSSFSGWDNYIP